MKLKVKIKGKSLQRNKENFLSHLKQPQNCWHKKSKERNMKLNPWFMSFSGPIFFVILLCFQTESSSSPEGATQRWEVFLSGSHDLGMFKGSKIMTHPCSHFIYLQFIWHLISEHLCRCCVCYLINFDTLQGDATGFRFRGLRRIRPSNWWVQTWWQKT